MPQVRLSSPDEYQAIVDAEWRIIYEKLENIEKSGAQCVLSRLAIGDLTTQSAGFKSVSWRI